MWGGSVAPAFSGNLKGRFHGLMVIAARPNRGVLLARKRSQSLPKKRSLKSYLLNHAGFGASNQTEAQRNPHVEAECQHGLGLNQKRRVV